MSLQKAKGPLINPNAPWANDPLSRKEAGEVLSTLISTLGESPFVISMKGGWGTGKSTFLERLSFHLERKLKIPVVRMDAWQSDYIDDPLLAMTTALGDRLSVVEKGRARRATAKVVTALAESAGKISLPALSILASAIVPGGGKVVDLASAMPDLAEGLLGWDRARRSAEERFRLSLAEAKDALKNSLESETEAPLVVIVDELDRCRPDFAIKFLERVKHFFNVDGVCFLIATDNDNLPEAVNAVYGQGVDGEKYLRKFFDFEFNLPKPSMRDYADHLFQSFPGANDSTRLPEFKNRLFNSLHASSYRDLLHNQPSALDQAEYNIFFGEISQSFGFQLRDAIQAHTLLMAFVRTFPARKTKFPFIDCYICCLRFKDPKQYRSLVNGDHPSAAGALLSDLKKNITNIHAIAKFLGIHGDIDVFNWENELSSISHKSHSLPLERLAYVSLLARTTVHLKDRSRTFTFDVNEYINAVLGFTASFAELTDDEASG